MPSGSQKNLNEARGKRDDAQEQFQIAFDANPAPSAIIRLADAVVVKANPGLPEITGRDNREVEGRSVRDLELFLSTEAFEQAVDTLKRGELVQKVEVRMCSVTEGERIAVMSANPIELEGDACAIFSVADITDLKRAERLFTQVFRLTPIPVVLLDEDDRFTDVNEGFLELTGYTRDEVVGKTSRKLGMWSSGEDHGKMASALAEAGEFRDLELSPRTKAGGTRHIAGSGRRLTVGDEVVLLHIFHDITERKQGETQLMGALQRVMADTSWFAQKVMEELAQVRVGGEVPGPKVDLSKREREVLQRLAKGANNERIAEELGIATQTVRNYISVVYDKLGVNSRAEAIVWARERGIV